jgi:nitroreductase
LDTLEAIKTKIEIRQFSDKSVPREIKSEVLEAARMTGSSSNAQHWRFLLVQKKDAVQRLAADSTSGGWVAGANFAVVILTNPKVNGHELDAGRAVQDMQLAAWNQGVGTGIFTGVHTEKLRSDFGIPSEMEISGVVGFGYPQKKVSGKKKKRNPLSEVAFVDRFGNKYNEQSLS